MRAFGVFIGLFLCAALIGGLLTYPAWSLLHGWIDVPIHRVLNRIGLLILAIATLRYLRRQGLINRAALGYNIPRSQFVLQLFLGYGAGLLLILPLVTVLVALNLRIPAEKLLISDAPALFVAKVIATGFITGCVVAFVEETFCRGALLSAIQRESGLAWAMVLSTVLYAATHFLGAETKLPHDNYTYISGLQVAAKLFERFTHPIDFVDSFLALAAFGTLLVLIRQRTGAIAACIGVHAGAVTIITAIRKATSVNTEAPLSWAVGQYDGVVGWLAFVWIGTIALTYWRITRTTGAEQSLIASVPAN